VRRVRKLARLRSRASRGLVTDVSVTRMSNFAFSAADAAWIADVPNLPTALRTGLLARAVAEVEQAVAAWLDAARPRARGARAVISGGARLNPGVSRGRESRFAALTANRLIPVQVLNARWHFAAHLTGRSRRSVEPGQTLAAPEGACVPPVAEAWTMSRPRRLPSVTMRRCTAAHCRYPDHNVSRPVAEIQATERRCFCRRRTAWSLTPSDEFGVSRLPSFHAASAACAARHAHGAGCGATST